MEEPVAALRRAVNHADAWPWNVQRCRRAAPAEDPARSRARPVDLSFGSHPEPRAVAGVYASNDADQKVLQDFVRAWTQVMNLERV